MFCYSSTYCAFQKTILNCLKSIADLFIFKHLTKHIKATEEIVHVESKLILLFYADHRHTGREVVEETMKKFLDFSWRCYLNISKEQEKG